MSKEKMTTNERFRRLFERKETDRVLMWDFPWPGAIRRWQNEGMPRDMEYEDFFDVDKVGRILVDNSPLYPEEIVDETDTFITKSTKWGGIVRDFKASDSTPDFMSYTITDPDIWFEAKKRITASPDRIPWDYLKENYPVWKKEDRWLIGYLFGTFENIASYVVGTERMLIALMDDPDWCLDMCHHFLDVNLQLLDILWDAGYTFDMLNLLDDMGYKNTQFYSRDIYRKYFKEHHKKAVDWAHKKNIPIRLHSCGNIMPFISEIIDIGINLYHPLEVKAGMNPYEIKKLYGDKLALHGGLNALLSCDGFDAIYSEMVKLIPVMMENGGYIFAFDHSIPNNISFKDMKEIIRLAKELGSYN